jgi:serine/threonine protein kinase
MKSSTYRSSIQSTIGESTAVQPSVSLRKVINTEWLQAGKADLIVALRRHPVLLRDRSLLLELAVEEYRTHRQTVCSIDLVHHCQRFEEFGSSIQRSILRQLETQRYIDNHPELLEALYSPQWPKCGDDFGSFQVIEELGFGASAHVYLCLQKDVGNRKVVVKTTPYSSFEASILGRLNHPNIIPIYSTGHIDEYNLHYLCMPFCGRSTLSDLMDLAFQSGTPRQDNVISLAARRWCVDERPSNKTRWRTLLAGIGQRAYVDSILRLSIQIAEALDHAHRQHILHGDLKPSNVLLTPSAEALLLDFNLSHDYASSRANYGGGTLPYMPPEYLRLVAAKTESREQSAFEPAADVYSFGALLYELLTGVTPANLTVKVDDVSEAAAHLLSTLEQGIAPIRRVNRLVSRRFEELILFCLALDKRNRPAAMADVKQELQAERRSLAAVTRYVRVRPLVFASVVGLPVVTLTAVAAHVAVQPPRYQTTYEQGMQFVSAGELNEAIEYFTAAVDSNPSYLPARFQLARARMTKGEIELAMNGFHQLARTNKHAHSMAYLGYCFNVTEVPAAAIAWYERAILHGAKTAAIYNNLAASYLEVPGQMTHAQRLDRAEDNLQAATALNPTSITIQLNVVRHAYAKAQLDPSYNPRKVWRQAKSVLTNAPDNSLARLHLALWYGALLRFEALLVRDHRTIEAVDSELDKSTRDSFTRLVQEMSPIIWGALPGGTRHSSASAVIEHASRVATFYLEPLSLEEPQP